MQVWIGTSGYSYADWVGRFYPSGTRPAGMLAYYCRHFPLVELNFTFYRLPTADMLLRLAKPAPAGFRFIVKIPQTLSHAQTDHDLAPFQEAITALRDENRLLGHLCQLPQASHDTPAQRRWIERLGTALQPFGLAIEFRHRSWFHREIPAWLADRGLDLVSVDVPALPGLYPKGLVRSSSRLYVRFHSGNADNWYRTDKDRYDYHYRDDELKEWITALGHLTPPADRVLLLFNNCQRSQAAANAQRMRELLERMGPPFEVVAPFASPPAEQQRLLFE